MTVCLEKFSTLLSTAAVSWFVLSGVLHCLCAISSSVHYVNSEYAGYLQPVVANLHELILSKCFS